MIDKDLDDLIELRALLKTLISEIKNRIESYLDLSFVVSMEDSLYSFGFYEGKVHSYKEVLKELEEMIDE